MEQSLKNGGFAVSPFFLIGITMIVLTLSIYFIQVRESSTESIGLEGRLNKAIMDVEKPKATVQSVVLLSAYQSAYEAGQAGMDKGGIESTLSSNLVSDLNSFRNSLGGEFGFSDDDFAVSIDGETYKDEGFIVTVTPTVTVTRDGAGVEVSSEIGTEKFVGARIFLLEKIDSENDIGGDIAREFKDNMECVLSGESSEERKCNVAGTGITCNKNWGDSKKPENFMIDKEEIMGRLGEALIQTERDVAEDYEEDEVALRFDADGIEVSVTQEVDKHSRECNCDEEGNCDEDPYWDVHLHIKGKIEDVDAYLVDYSTIRGGSNGDFKVCVESPVLLKNGNTEPLEYHIGPFDISYEIDIYWRDECNGPPDFSRTGKRDIDKPSYENTNLKFKAPDDTEICEFGITGSLEECADEVGLVRCGDCGEGGGEEPEEPTCSVVDGCKEKKCYDGDVWCYDNCGERNHLKENCPDGCEGGVCIVEDCFYGERTNEYYEPSEAGCSPGTKTDYCNSEDDCVTCMDRCIKSGDTVDDKEWLCLKGKLDKCNKGDDYERDNWKCENGVWGFIPPTTRTNEYYEPSEADCSPGTKTGSCSSSNDCVDCYGECKKPDGVSFSGKWLCLDGKWDKCNKGDDYERDNWKCENGVWGFIPCEG